MGRVQATGLDPRVGFGYGKTRPEPDLLPFLTTTLERQVQTIATSVECLTKQNHDLEEQLCQKNVGLDTQKEDQEGISVEQRDQDGTEGSNALS